MTSPWYRTSVIALLGSALSSACGGSQKAPESPATASPEAPSADENAEKAAPAGAPEAAPAPASGAAPAQAAEAPSSTRAGAAGGAEDDMETLTRRFDGTLALSTPDCTSAWALRDRICDLSQRLCDLASRSAEPEVAERCTDGRARCERATSRVRASCAE